LNESTGTRYQRLRRTGQVVSLSVGAAWLSVVVFTPVGRWAADVATAVGGDWAFLVFVTGLVLVWELVALPAGVHAAVRGERNLRRGETSAAALLADQVRSAGTGTAIAVTGASIVWFALGHLGPWWWIVVGLLGAPVLLTATAIAGVTARSAAGSRPLVRPELEVRLAALAARACGRPVPVREWSDASADGPTAVVTGIGASGAILLSHELVTGWSDEEVEVVVAHELSHHAHHDLWRKAGLDAVVLMASLGTAHIVALQVGPRLGITGLSDLTVLPLIGLVAWVAWWGLRPVRLAQSRRHEREADRFAIALTGSPDAFRAVVKRLAALHLAEERPSTLTRWFFHRHPTVEERLKSAGSRMP
jgi:STE24 endopeptidase